MPKPWFFPRWRYIAMQVVMWLVLAGTVGLAAMLDIKLRNAERNLLGEVITDGNISYRLPAGWKTSAHAINDMLSLHSAIEPTVGDTASAGRMVTISRQRISRMMAPVEYLRLTGQIGSNPLVDNPAPISLDGWPGQRVQSVGIKFATGGAAESQSLMYCVILPTREAVTFRFDKPGAFDKADVKLIKVISDSINISGIPDPATGAVQLTGGITATAPADYQIMPEPDPLRIDRLLVYARDKNWVTIQLVPVLVPTDQPAASFQQMLAAGTADSILSPHAQRWLNAPITAIGADRWLIDPQDPADQFIHRRAYLMGQAGGRGLLVVMEATAPADDDELDAAWTALEPTVQFSQPADVARLLNGGAAVLKQIKPKKGIGSRQMALLMHDKTPQGWDRAYVDATGQNLVRDHRRLNWDQTVTRIEERFGSNSEGVNLWAQTARGDARAATDSRFMPTFTSIVRLTDVLTVDLQLVGTEITPASMPIPPAFVLGSRLPDLLASLPPGTVALTTDRFPGVEGNLLLQPVVLTVRKTDAMTEVQVNGLGETSRWYFTGDGALDRAEFAGGLTLKPAELKDVTAAFANDPRLTPRP